MMMAKNTTTYSIVGSLGVHMLFTLGAGSFLLNINTNVEPKKTYKLEFVKKKKIPPIKKEPVRQEIKVASLPPKAMSVLQPRAAVQQTRKAVVPIQNPISREMKQAVIKKSSIMRSSRPTLSRRVTTPLARSMTVKMQQGSSVIKSVVIYKSRPSLRKSVNAPVRSFVQADINSKPVKGGIKVAMVQGKKHFKTRKLPKSRGVPNIVDKGALKSYMIQVQRSVEGAKRYPESSRRAGRQGKLKVQFTILKNGEVDNITLLTETPYPNLNREAMAAVKRAAPFSGFPDIIMKQSLKVILPFRFEIN
jgi:TonB family protein